jgi:hypothetical protein
MFVLPCCPQALVDTRYRWLDRAIRTLARACLESDGRIRPHIEYMLKVDKSYVYVRAKGADVLCPAEYGNRELL